MAFKLGYIHSTEGAAIALLAFTALTFLIPGVGPSEEVQIILTISTFLFAILAGFFISRLGSRYNQTRELLASEDSLFVSLYRTSKVYGKAFSDRIRELIDKYYILGYDFILESNEFNEKHFRKMWDEVAGMKKNRKDSVYENLIADLTEIGKCRSTQEAMRSERLDRGQWVVMVFLSGIILFSMFYLKTFEIYSQIITILLSTVLVLVLLIMRDLQNFMLGGSILLEESGEQVMESIGRPRYYNHVYLRKKHTRIPSYVKEYRLGMHEPGSDEFDIKLVKNENYRNPKKKRV